MTHVCKWSHWEVTKLKGGCLLFLTSFIVSPSPRKKSGRQSSISRISSYPRRNCRYPDDIRELLVKYLPDLKEPLCWRPDRMFKGPPS